MSSKFDKKRTVTKHYEDEYHMEAGSIRTDDRAGRSNMGSAHQSTRNEYETMANEKKRSRGASRGSIDASGTDYGTRSIQVAGSQLGHKASTISMKGVDRFKKPSKATDESIHTNQNNSALALIRNDNGEDSDEPQERMRAEPVSLEHDIIGKPHMKEPKRKVIMVKKNQIDSTAVLAYSLGTSVTHLALFALTLCVQRPDLSVIGNMHRACQEEAKAYDSLFT